MAELAGAIRRRAPRRVPWRLVTIWSLAAILACTFLFTGLRGNVSFVVNLRLTQLIGMVQVAVAVAVSTVVFQTITNNRILSPSIMGLDALYLFCQTALVFALGGFGYAALDPAWKFSGEAVLMMAASAALFVPMLRRGSEMLTMILTGVVLGLLFRSLSSLLSRLIDPNDFAVLQGASFANFQSLDPALLVAGGTVTVLGTLAAWRTRHTLDVVALGREAAVGLGLDWNRTVTAHLLLVACLVASATALVGPLAFLGLLVVAVAERICGTRRHAVLFPAACGVGVVMLVGAQLIGRAGFGGAVVISVIVEFVGGLVFLALLFARRRQ
jgi:iron complex transport system permease protein